MSHLAPYPGTRSARRAVALLKAFGEGPRSRNLTELARRVRLSKATAFRLLGALESEGLVTKETESGEYRLGPEAIALGWLAVQSNALVPTVRPILERLARQSRETASLEILADGQVLVLDEAEAGRRVEIGSWVGSRWPVHATSTGKVLLASLEPSEARRSAGRVLRRFTDRTITSKAALERELAQVRRSGVARAIEELEPGFAAVAAPVRRHDGLVVAAISIGGPTARLGQRRMTAMASLARRGAEQASRALGWSPPRIPRGRRPAPQRRSP